MGYLSGSRGYRSELRFTVFLYNAAKTQLSVYISGEYTIKKLRFVFSSPQVVLKVKQLFLFVVILLFDLSAPTGCFLCSLLLLKISKQLKTKPAPMLIYSRAQLAQ